MSVCLFFLGIICHLFTLKQIKNRIRISAFLFVIFTQTGPYTVSSWLSYVSTGIASISNSAGAISILSVYRSNFALPSSKQIHVTTISLFPSGASDFWKWKRILILWIKESRKCNAGVPLASQSQSHFLCNIKWNPCNV